jgi:1-acyl-sn-glycerol-3-phosphate acyltransferase
VWWAVLAWAVLAGWVLLRWRRSGHPFWLFAIIEVQRTYARLWHGLRMNRPCPLPAKGAALLVANHTSSTDPAFLQAGCARPLAFLQAREYHEDLPWLRWVFDETGCVPVARNGRDVRAVRTALRHLKQGRVVGVFPEGGLSGAGKGRIHRCRCGIALLALRSGAPVFPAFIDGGPQHWHVARAWMFPSRARVTFGPAVDLSAYRGRRINRPLLEEVTAYLMSHVAALDPKTNHRGTEDTEAKQHRETRKKKSETKNKRKTITDQA